MNSAPAHRSALAPLSAVPPACYLCRGGRLALRFPARGGAAPSGPEAYNCTSFGHRQHPPIWGCLDCEMLFQWPMKTGAELVHAYSRVEDPLYMAEKDNRYLTFNRVLR